MDKLRDLADVLAVPAVLGLLGGAVSILRYGVRSWRDLGVNVLTAMFTGCIMHLLLSATSLPDLFQAGCVAMAGYIGGALLDAAKRRTVEAVESMPIPWDGTERRDYGRGRNYDGPERRCGPSDGPECGE